MSPQLYLGVDKLLLTCVTRCAAGKPSLTARIKAEPMPAPAPASSQRGRNKIKELLKTLSMDIFLTSLTPLFGEEFRWSRDWLRHVPFPAFSSRHQGIQPQVLLLGVASALPWHQASQDTCEPASLRETQKAECPPPSPQTCSPVMIFSPAAHKCNKWDPNSFCFRLGAPWSFHSWH